MKTNFLFSHQRFFVYAKWKIQTCSGACVNWSFHIGDKKLPLHHQFVLSPPGLYNVSNCNPNFRNHAVLVVGYGTSRGRDFWLIKNRWVFLWWIKMFIKKQVFSCSNLKKPSVVVLSVGELGGGKLVTWELPETDTTSVASASLQSTQAWKTRRVLRGALGWFDLHVFIYDAGGDLHWQHFVLLQSFYATVQYIWCVINITSQSVNKDNKSFWDWIEQNDDWLTFFFFFYIFRIGTFVLWEI